MSRIVVKNVSKRFNIGLGKKHGALQRILSFLSGEDRRRYIWALRNVSFTSKPKEIVGIIGYNGSGKSTLLRAVGGIYEVDEGTIRTEGKIVSVLSMYAGLNAKLDMVDNINLVCTLLDLTSDEIRKSFDDIVEFSGLGRFLNTKLYKFSDGMLQRLAFSIVVHCNPDVLLLDEVFQVGDKTFQAATAEKLDELKKGGATILFTSHGYSDILDYTDRLIWLHKGKIMMEGKPEDVYRAYAKTDSFTV